MYVVKNHLNASLSHRRYYSSVPKCTLSICDGYKDFYTNYSWKKLKKQRTFKNVYCELLGSTHGYTRWPVSSFLINEDHVSVLSLAMSALSDLSIVEMSAGTVCSQKYKCKKSTILKIFWLKEIYKIFLLKDIYTMYKKETKWQWTLAWKVLEQVLHSTNLRSKWTEVMQTTIYRLQIIRCAANNTFTFIVRYSVLFESLPMTVKLTLSERNIISAWQGQMWPIP